MINGKVIFVALLAYLVVACGDKNIVEVPIKFIDDYGPFGPRWSKVRTYAVDNKEDMSKFYPSEVMHLPKELTDMRIGSVPIGYVNVGILDIDTFSVDIFDRSIVVAYGRDEKGKIRMVIDANRNHKLDDDAVLDLPFFTNFDKINEDSLVKHPVMVNHYQRFNSKIIEKKVPLLIAYVEEIEELANYFPQHAVAVLDEQEIAIVSSHGLSYNPIKIYPITSAGEQIQKHDLIAENEYITIGGNTYQNKGVSLNRNALLLKMIDSSGGQLYSAQPGYKAHPFSGIDYLTNEPISLDAYKGKYLLIDFWATWCGPCIADMPELKALYEQMDSSKIELLGIVLRSEENRLKELLASNKHIIWPQLYDKNNKIVKTYNISTYPTTLLIDPQGVVVAKNLRGAALKSKIGELNLLR